MEIKIIEDKKKRMLFNVEGGSHTLCNILKEELWNDSNVKVSSYSIRHPLVGVPQMIVETDGTEPKKAITSAIGRLKKQAEKFENEFVKEVK